MDDNTLGNMILDMIRETLIHNERLYTVPEVELILGVTRRTMLNRERKRNITPRIVNGKKMYSQKEIRKMQ